MRFTTVLSFLAFATLSSQSFTGKHIRRQNSTTEPQFTSPCQEVAASRTGIIGANAAYRCLTSMPFNATASVAFIKGFKKFLQFQSTLAFAADPPPQSYGREPIDIMQGLDSISAAAASNLYKNHYEFEEAIRKLLRKLHDGHVSWRSNCLEGVFTFIHPFYITALAETPDDIPKIYAFSDIPYTIVGTNLIVDYSQGYNPSAISEIEGTPVNEYLSDWIERTDAAFHDPDTRWNSLFVRRTEGNLSPGMFAQSVLYQGDNFTVTFENGTQKTILWSAEIKTSFSNITSGEDLFYKNCLVNTPALSTVLASQVVTTEVPIPTQDSVPKSTPSSPVPTQVLGYPLARDIAMDSRISTYTLNNSTGVIVVHTFLVTDDKGAQEFQAFITKTINDFKSLGIERVIVDVTGNGGGNIVLGYELFKQFFPDVEPFAATNMRAHPASAIFYSVVSEVLRSTTYTNEAERKTWAQSTFSYFYQRDVNGVYFPSWEQAYGPVHSYNDTFTNLTRWDLVSVGALGMDINVTNADGMRNASYKAPWSAENIVIVGDGTCSSTCTLFTEAMKEVGVRTFAYGGRPQPGPMQMIGGTEGSQTYSFNGLISLSMAALEIHPEKAEEWSEFLPMPLPFMPYPNYSLQSINLKNSFRQSMCPNMDIPLEFIYDAATYRVQMTKDFFRDVMTLWSEVASRVWYNK